MDRRPTSAHCQSHPGAHLATRACAGACVHVATSRLTAHRHVRTNRSVTTRRTGAGQAYRALVPALFAASGVPVPRQTSARAAGAEDSVVDVVAGAGRSWWAGPCVVDLDGPAGCVFQCRDKVVDL